LITFVYIFDVEINNVLITRQLRVCNHVKT